MQVEHKILSFSLLITAFVILVLSLTSPFKAHAQYYSEGNQNKAISVDKKIRSVSDGGDYSNNIEKNTKLFFDGDVVEYSISIENIGSQTLNNIQVIDSLPTNLSLIFNPGTFDKTSNKITWSINPLKSAEVKTYLIRAKIIDSTKLNIAINDAVKLTNVVDVRSDTGKSDSDNASFYVGKGSIPKTGNGALIIQTILVLGTGTGGFYLRKFVRGY